jgi:hypothetical protein
MIKTNIEFNSFLIEQGWNVRPRLIHLIPSSENPLVNAARAIAVCAYPHPKNHGPNGKATKYSASLIAYIFRVAKLVGKTEKLPAWIAEIKVESMERHLFTGSRNLHRAFAIRDIINSAVTMKIQHNDKLKGRKSTFLLNYSPDLKSMSIKIPLEDTVSGYILSGCVPDTKIASLRAAILYHRPALARFEGPAVKSDGRDSELDYQNVYNRHVRPAMFAQHIVQEVWERATDYLDESLERGLPIDQILMRKAVWATDIHRKTAKGMGAAILTMRELGVPSCACSMVQFADPLPAS